MEHMGLLSPTCMGWRQSATREGRAPATGGDHIIMVIIITTIIIITIPKTVHREPNKQDKNYFPSQKVFLLACEQHTVLPCSLSSAHCCVAAPSPPAPPPSHSRPSARPMAAWGALRSPHAPLRTLRRINFSRY